MYRNDRDNKGGGGVAVLLRENYSVQVIDNLPYTANIEVIAVKVQVKTNRSFIVVCVYRPPNLSQDKLKTDSENFEEILNKLVLRGRVIVITGDFNLPSSASYSYFEHILHSYSLTQLVNQPTRLDNLLDLFITNNRDIMSEVNVTEPHISDHQMLIATMAVPRASLRRKLITYRDFKNADFGLLGKEICNIRIPSDETTTSELVKSFTSDLLALFDKYVPVVTKQITETSKKIRPSPETIYAKSQRDSAYKLANLEPSVENVNNYKMLNKSVKKLITEDSKDNINIMINKKGVYTALKSFCKIKSDKGSVQFNMDANLINDYFIKISTDDKSEALLLTRRCLLLNVAAL